MFILAGIEQLLFEVLGSLFKEALKKMVATGASLKDAPASFFITVGVVGTSLIALTILCKRYKRSKFKENEA